MPQVELSELDVKPGSDIRKFNLFLPFCIHENEGGRIEYDTEYFKQIIKTTIDAYIFTKKDEDKDEDEDEDEGENESKEKPFLNILVADTLDWYNRCAPEDAVPTQSELDSMSKVEHEERNQRIADAVDKARKDGDSWIKTHEPVLIELGLLADVDYKIYHWDDFLEKASARGTVRGYLQEQARDEPPKEPGYLEQFKEKVRLAAEQKLMNRFRTVAKNFQQSRKGSNYRQLLNRQKERLIDVSIHYLLEDLGVSFYIAQEHSPTLFFSNKQSEQFIDLINQCNQLLLNGDDNFVPVHFQIRIDSKKELTKRDEKVVPINGNHALLFRGRDPAGIAQELQSLKKLRSGIVETHSQMQNQLNVQLKHIDDRINFLLEQLTVENENMSQQERMGNKK